MYSAEQRVKAIETFARFRCNAADTIAELGYPNRATLRNWWKEHRISGDEFLERRHRRPRYSDEERQGAVDHHLEHGKSLARTIRAMGYPSREVLANWVDELAPGQRKHRGSNPKKGVLPIEMLPSIKFVPLSPIYFAKRANVNAPCAPMHFRRFRHGPDSAIAPFSSRPASP